MRGRTGTSTIYTTILPKQSYLDRICTKKLSKEAKHRLKIIDYFFLKADKNVSLTVRHFGVTREYIYYFAHPHTPKEKPFVERFIGSLQRECLDVHKDDIVTEDDLVYYVNRWLNNYHFLRPHQSLNYETPAAFCAKMGITIYRREVYMM